MSKEIQPVQGYPAEYYGDHASFLDERYADDYAFRVEFHKDMPEAQRKAIMGMIEAGPKLLAAVQEIIALEDDGYSTYAEILPLLSGGSALRAAVADATAALDEHHAEQERQEPAGQTPKIKTPGM